MSDLVIRPATIADIPDIVAMLADDSLGASRETPSDLPPYYAAFERITTDPHQHLMVADVGGALVGTMQLSVLHGMASRGATRVQVESVRVASGVRGCGLGTAMMRWAIDFGEQLGATQLQLTSHGTRTDAHRFYERLGFMHSHHGYKMVLS